MASTAHDQAVEAICQINYHQSLWLPSTGRDKMRVTFSTTSNFDDSKLPAVLFIAPMFGTRWMSLLFNKLSQDCGIRLICVDRPGFSGSTAVDIKNRMEIWLETVPALLHRLNIKHVSLVTHSAGAIYTLNTLRRHRSLLDPLVPYVGFIAPYVPFTHSGATATTLLSYLPTGVVSQCAGLTNFINKNVVPSASWSGGLISSTAALFSPSTGTEGDLPTSTPLTEQYGFDDETAAHIKKLSAKYQLAENNEGGNEEAKLCLRKCDDAAWGDAADYKGCIRRVIEHENGIEHGTSSATKLCIEAFFASSDVLVAKGGQTYFDGCWQTQDPNQAVKFTTTTLPGTDHDSILVDLQKGAMRQIFERIAKLHTDATITT